MNCNKLNILKYISLVLSILLLTNISTLYSQDVQKISEELNNVTSKKSDDAYVPVLVMFNKNPAELVDEELLTTNKNDIAKQIVNTAKESQNKAKIFLQQSIQKGKARKVQYIYSANAIGVELRVSLLDSLSAYEGVSKITHDPGIPLEKQFDLSGNSQVSRKYLSSNNTDTTWGLKYMNVPKVWDMGIKGEDVLISIIDSGFDYDHKDLDSHLWDGSEFDLRVKV